MNRLATASTKPVWRPAQSALILALASGACWCQVSLPYDWKSYFSPDTSFGGAFGENMLVSDINFDGFGDLIATDAQKSALGVPGAGKAFILFGPTLEMHLEIVADNPTTEAMGQWTVSVGDTNGDGEYDVFLGSANYDAGGPLGTNFGRAHVFLGPTFDVDIVLDDPLPEPDGDFGYAVQLADVDGDGLDDAIVGAPGKSRLAGSVVLQEAGQVWYWRGSDLASRPTELLQPKPQATGQFGRSMTAVPGASAKDLIVSAPNYTPPNGVPGKGYLYRYGGPTFTLLAPIAAPTPALFQYTRFYGLLDVDHDGFEDLLNAHFNGVAAAAIVSGPDFAAAQHFFVEEDPSGVGYGLRAAYSDLDRDGNIDVLVSDGDWMPTVGAVHVYWGPDFSASDLIGPGWFDPPVTSFGNGLACGDLDGDGYDEIAVQTPGGFSGGIVYVLRRQTLQASATSLSIAAGDVVDFTLDLPPDQAGRPYLAALSLTDPGAGLILGPGSYLPLMPDSMTAIGLSLLGSSVLPGFLGTLDAQGDASLSLDWPDHKGASLAGQTLHIAAITATPENVPAAGSNEVTILLQP